MVVPGDQSMPMRFVRSWLNFRAMSLAENASEELILMDDRPRTLRRTWNNLGLGVALPSRSD